MSTVGVLRCRQRAGIEFTVDRQRQRRQHHHRRRDHIRRQPVGQHGARDDWLRLPGHIPTRRLSPGRSSRAITTACSTPSRAFNAA